MRRRGLVKPTAGASQRPNVAALRREWSEALPEISESYERAQDMWDAHHRASDFGMVPEPWKVMVAEMRAKVLERASDPDGATDEPDVDRRGAAWSSVVGIEVGRMMRYLARTILTDVGFGERENMHSNALLEEAVAAFASELASPAIPENPDEGGEKFLRVSRALQQLIPRFDDIALLRYRALLVAEQAASHVSIPSEAEVQAHVARYREVLAETPRPDMTLEEHDARSRAWMLTDAPLTSAMIAHDALGKVDPRFWQLDTLLVAQEFAEAQTSNRGGKTDTGDGRVGPVRALARLAVTCGALDFEQGPKEDFDRAVDRARGILITARSKIRAEIRNPVTARAPGAPPTSSR